MQLKSAIVGLVAAAGVAGVVESASAAFVPWTNPNGSNAFMSWSGGGSTDALWGDPTIAGTTFTFNPTNFRAESSNGIADTVDGLLQFNIDIAPGYQITGFSINETGFYSILGLGSVKASGLLVVEDRDTTIEYTDTLSTSPAMPVIHNANPFGGVSGQWTGVMAVTLPNGVTRVTVVVDNNLQALSVPPGPGVPGSTSFIDKKNANAPLTISIFIPEPASAGALAGFGLVLLARRRRTS